VVLLERIQETGSIGAAGVGRYFTTCRQIYHPQIDTAGPRPPRSSLFQTPLRSMWAKTIEAEYLSHQLLLRGLENIVQGKVHLPGVEFLVAVIADHEGLEILPAITMAQL
jgi:hypothetical protein